MKKMLFGLIVISILSTGTAFAQRRSSHSVQGGRHEVVRTEACRNYGGGGYRETYVREYNYGHRSPGHHGYMHHRPYRSAYHCPPPRPVYRERVIVTPAPVAYSYPCPAPAYSYPVPTPVPVPVPATTVVVETAPVHPAISIGALAGALIGGSIAAAACR